MRTIEEMNNFFEALYLNNCQYVWGANFQVITPQAIVDVYHANRTEKYNSNYYEKKLYGNEGKWMSDCSGAFYALAGHDRTAKDYYKLDCTKKGNISEINPNVACMVFKGNTPETISHIGWYMGSSAGGYVIEMQSSETNCVKRQLEQGNWQYFGLPTWVDYSKVSSTIPTNIPTTPVVKPTPTTTTAPTNNTTIIKGIDISSYNKISNYKALKDANVNFAVLKIIRKDLTPDKLFETHYKNCKSVGINCDDVYNYSYATTVDKAKVDAQKVIDTLKGRKMRVWLDVEDKCQQNIGKRLIDIINAYQTVINNSGNDCGLYTGMSFYKSYIKPYEANLKCNKLWIARYYKGDTVMNLSDNPNETYNPSKNIGKNIWAWQYTSSLSLPNACTGKLDCSVYYGTQRNEIEGNIVEQTTNVFENPVELLCRVHNCKSLNVREQPNIHSKDVGDLLNGAYVQATAVTSNGWWKIWSNKYCSGEYCSPVIGKVVSKNGIGIVETPLTTAKLLDSLVDGALVNVKKDVVNGFYKVSTSDGLVGYAHKDYIKLL